MYDATAPLPRPFAHFIDSAAAPSPLLAAITTVWRVPEPQAVAELLEQARRNFPLVICCASTPRRPTATRR